MFGFLRSKNHTGQPGEHTDAKGRLAFIRRLVKERIEASPEAKLSLMVEGINVDDLPEFVLLGTPEASIIRIVERYIKARDMGASNVDAVQLTHLDLTAIMTLGGSPLKLTSIPNPASLWYYCFLFINCEFSDSAPVHVRHIERVASEALRFYGRLDILYSISTV